MVFILFSNANEENTIFLLYQAILTNEVCPAIVLSDKGTQFYNSKKNKKGELTPSLFEQEFNELGIEFWTSRRDHPQTNGKMEKWFDTFKIINFKNDLYTVEVTINFGIIQKSLGYPNIYIFVCIT